MVLRIVQSLLTFFCMFNLLSQQRIKLAGRIYYLSLKVMLKSLKLNVDLNQVITRKRSD